MCLGSYYVDIWFLIFCNATMLVVNCYNWRRLQRRQRELSKTIAEAKQDPVNLTWEAASKIYANAYAYRMEARKLRDEWKFAKMLSDANHEETQ